MVTTRQDIPNPIHIYAHRPPTVKRAPQMPSPAITATGLLVEEPPQRTTAFRAKEENGASSIICSQMEPS